MKELLKLTPEMFKGMTYNIMLDPLSMTPRKYCQCLEPFEEIAGYCFRCGLKIGDNPFTPH